MGFTGFTGFIGFTGFLGLTGLARRVFIAFALPGSTTPHEDLAQVENTRVPPVQLINT